jgi:iron complex outermembrane receptor protein
MKFFFFTFFISLKAFAQEDAYELAPLQVIGNKENKTYLESSESISIFRDTGLNRGDQDNSIQTLNGLGNVQVSKNGEIFRAHLINILLGLS